MVNAARALLWRALHFLDPLRLHDLARRPGDDLSRNRRQWQSQRIDDYQVQFR
jgi:hypothetical protein